MCEAHRLPSHPAIPGRELLASSRWRVRRLAVDSVWHAITTACRLFEEGVRGQLPF